MSDSLMRLRVEKLIWRGRGLARPADAPVVIVEPGVLPGEEIQARITKRHKDYLRAKCETVLEPASERRPHPCPASPACGGCRFGITSQRTQLALKQAIMADTLRRHLGKEVPASVLESPQVVPSPKGWRYRWRGQLHVHQGQPHLLGQGSHAKVPIERCLLFARPLAEALPRLARDLPDGRHTVAASPVDHAVASALETHRLSLPLPGGLAVDVLPQTFFQANQSLNPALVEHIRSWCPAGSRVADLYAGAGNFGLPLAQAGNPVFAVEGDGPALQAARTTAARSGLDHWQGRQADLRHERAWKHILEFQPDVVVADPPRSGSGPVCRHLLHIPSLERIIWISCDLTNSARDVRSFLTQGWQLTSLALFDMFPQTWHMEGVFILDRRGSNG